MPPTVWLLTSEDPASGSKAAHLRNLQLADGLKEFASARGANFRTSCVDGRLSDLRDARSTFDTLHELLTRTPLQVPSLPPSEILAGDLVWISEIALAAAWAPRVATKGAAVIVDQSSLDSILELRHGRQLQAWVRSRSERRAFGAASLITVGAEAYAVRARERMKPGIQVAVIPDAVALERYEGSRMPEAKQSLAPAVLAFPGRLNYAPNVRGLEWFLEEVLPRLRAALGDRVPEIRIIGRDPDLALISRAKAQGLNLISEPSAIVPAIRDSTVVFVPLRSGTATRIKILEAMASRKAIVSTGRALEGLGLAPGRDLLVADDPDGFTSSLLKLIRDSDLRATLAHHAFETVRDHRSWAVTRACVISAASTASETAWKARP